MKTAKDNRFLLVRAGVILTPVTELVIVSLDERFESEGKVAYVSSCVRTPDSQLSTIRGYMAKTGLDKQYPEAIICDLNQKTAGHYVWQLGWSALLNNGIIINPPFDAECLMDYIGFDGKNRKGKIIPSSGHIRGQQTKCFDISGGTDGIDGDTVSEQKILQKALADKIPGLKGVVLERKNNCVHVDCI